MDTFRLIGIIIIGITLVNTGLIVIIITGMWKQSQHMQSEFSVVIDAGTTGTRLFVYRWKEETNVATQREMCTVKGPGLSSYWNDPKGLSPGLKTCLKEAMEIIPNGERADTPIYLGATAGMRHLDEVNKSASDAILTVARETIKEFSFKFSDPENHARIITMAEEGLYSWVTINHITGRFGMVSGEGEDTAGALDMGGASTQITFHPKKDDYSSHLVLFGRSYSLYSHSYRCFGANTATDQFRALLVKKQNYRNIIYNPCGPRGNSTFHTHDEIFNTPCTLDSRFKTDIGAYQNTTYTFVGGSNNTACHSQVQELFNFSAPCPWGDKCSFDGTYQPDVYGKFYAFAAFYFQVAFMNLTASENVDIQIYSTELAKLCSKSWNEVKDMRTISKKLLPLICFYGHYMYTMLNEAYKFEDWSNISFVRKLNGTEVGWTLGYMIVLNGDHKGQEPSNLLSKTIFCSLLVLCVSIMILGIILMIVSVCPTCKCMCMFYRRRRLDEQGNCHELTNQNA